MHRANCSPCPVCCAVCAGVACVCGRYCSHFCRAAGESRGVDRDPIDRHRLPVPSIRIPLLLRSGKFGTPLARMHLENASVELVEVELLPVEELDPEAVGCCGRTRSGGARAAGGDRRRGRERGDAVSSRLPRNGGVQRGCASVSFRLPRGGCGPRSAGGERTVVAGNSSVSAAFTWLLPTIGHAVRMVPAATSPLARNGWRRALRRER